MGGAGDDTYTHDFTTGSVSGTVDGGDGMDTFGIIGTGTFAFPDFALNFETMSVGNDVTFEFNGEADSFFDVSMAVINEGTINAQSGNLNFLVPFELNGGTLSAASDASLTPVIVV